MTKRNDRESKEQQALVRWARLRAKTEPRLKWLFAIPNGGSRHIWEAVRLKAEGVQAGVSDLLLPYPICPDKYALWIEMKTGKNQATAQQREFMADMQRVGYSTAVCYSWTEAKAVICEYLGIRA